MAAIGTRFWCPMTYRSRIINPASSSNRGSQHNFLDYNPDTVYIGTITSICGGQLDVDVRNDYDFGVTFFAMFARNTHNYNYTIRLQVWRSNDYNNWGSAVAYFSLDDTYYYPLIIRDLAGVSMAKYWRWDLFSNNGEIVEGSMVMVGRYYDVSVRWNWGSPAGQAFLNHGIRTYSGRQNVSLGPDDGIFKAVRIYEGISDSDMNAIRAAWADTKGGAYPMIITDDIPAPGWNPNSAIANSRTSRLVRFNHPLDENGDVTLGEIQIQNGIWNVVLYLAEVPWEGEGEIL